MMVLMDRLDEIKAKLGRGTITKAEYDEYVALDGYPPGQRPLRFVGQHPSADAVKAALDRSDPVGVNRRFGVPRKRQGRFS